MNLAMMSVDRKWQIELFGRISDACEQGVRALPSSAGLAILPGIYQPVKRENNEVGREAC